MSLRADFAADIPDWSYCICCTIYWYDGTRRTVGFVVHNCSLTLLKASVNKVVPISSLGEPVTTWKIYRTKILVRICLWLKSSQLSMVFNLNEFMKGLKYKWWRVYIKTSKHSIPWVQLPMRAHSLWLGKLPHASHIFIYIHLRCKNTCMRAWVGQECIILGQGWSKSKCAKL